MPPTKQIEQWFETLGWKAFPFQQEAWQAYQAGKSGLIHAPTGIGKTYAAVGGPVIQALNGKLQSGLQVLWITPLRALANDTADAISRMLEGVGLNWTVEIRHGDVSSSTRQRQKRRLPELLVTTPESLTVLLSYEDASEKFSRVNCVICDEWHELLGTKRGIQTELALSRLQAINPELCRWGLSATIGNVEEALEVLTGAAINESILIEGKCEKQIEIETLLPETIEKFPWAGHLGIRLLPEVIQRIRSARTSLVFTNTRAQCEIWYQSLIKAEPELEPLIALHHGSLDRDLRNSVEQRLDSGELRAVVCTSSLDLGVDFSPVEQVIQIGSPKGIARLVQRAGRSGHQPGATSKIFGVPTNALEILEFAAAREALKRKEIEPRKPVQNALDVLLQHVITMSLNGTLTEKQLRQEVYSTAAFQKLADDDWNWIMSFAKGQTGALQAYPEYSKVIEENGVLKISEKRIERMHRMSIGTITSDSEVTVRLKSGPVLGQIEERFVTRLKPGDHFSFAGSRLELVRFRGMVALVKRAGYKAGSTPSWQGGRAPLSSELASAVSRELAEYSADHDNQQSIELKRLASLLDIQRERSDLPMSQYLLIEQCRVKRTSNLFCFPFAGRLVHEGLAALVAYRLSRQLPLTLKTTVNDYGFSLQSARKFEVDEAVIQELFQLNNLAEDLLECMNTTELARRQFREISRISGLVFQGYPGQQKTVKNVQMSASLLYDVFAKYDTDNRLLLQAKAELLERQLEQTRLRETLDRIQTVPIRLHTTKKLSPFAFPLWAEALHQQVSSESWADKIALLAAEMEA
ncbi:ligase-associated DNA damage response DEXH box helicase [Rubellicoccus peritrichatus]|uniref:Ligase-associated DNA damage response DEXH box helicase n=1 Tax=Rubellicoccus peritrichatus TaxID=3080537 RepID=A0AAQ3L9P6_9BACT|nr:ligase-associated DNA damage response DEXH box helicase [Puniceicoccus sp. CR14]WOO42194.1 ligase-associated DNA damage response DEXH box helicase [Puniceicoccus sp. CR14]